MPQNAYPKEVTVHFRSLPHFVEEKVIFEILQLPKMKKLTTIMKEKIQLEDGGFVFPGKAYSKLLVENREELEELTKWTEEKCTEVFQYEEIDFYCNIPTLLACSYCAENNRNSRGHHVKYCFEKKKRGFVQKRQDMVHDKKKTSNEDGFHTKRHHQNPEASKETETENAEINEKNVEPTKKDETKKKNEKNNPWFKRKQMNENESEEAENGRTVDISEGEENMESLGRIIRRSERHKKNENKPPSNNPEIILEDGEIEQQQNDT